MNITNKKKNEEARKRWEQLRNYGGNAEYRFGGRPREIVLDSKGEKGSRENKGTAPTDLSPDSVLGRRPEDYASKYQQQIDTMMGQKPGQSATEQALANKPGEYASQNQQQIDSLYDQIVNRQPFNFDLGNNALYQQYRDQYTRLGQQAMTDTMGQAAGLTGGYGSSYGQSVGQQAYNAYLQELNNVVPDLYAQARSEYDAQGQNLMSLYGLAVDRENQGYNRYMDAYNRWLQEYGLAADRDNADYNRWLQEYGLLMDRENMDYNRYADAYNRWLQEYGLSQDQANWEAELAFQREQWEWKKEQSGKSGSGSGGSGGSYGGYGSYGGGSSGVEFTDDELSAIAEKYVVGGMPYGTSSPELTSYLDSLGLDSAARAIVLEIIKEYGAELGKQYYKGGGGGGGKSTIAAM